MISLNGIRLDSMETSFVSKNISSPAETPLAPFSDMAENPQPEVINTETGYALQGSECSVCGRKFFLRRSLCPGCTDSTMLDVPLSSKGTLYTFTTVHVSSARKTPYSIGYVDLSDGVRVLATIAGDAQALTPDAPVQLVVTGDGWAFARGEAAEGN
jgi:uncharacterized OB-fold protein